jgi:hypothetical protein
MSSTNPTSPTSTTQTTANPNGGVIKRTHFRSAQTFADWARPHAHKTNLGDWGDVPARLKGLELLEQGDTSIVPEARKLVREFQEQIPSLKRVWKYSPVGPISSVPRYLANHPLSMRTLSKRESFSDPLKIWVGLSSRADVTNEQMRLRGAALVAFALALAERRSVFITPYKHTYDRQGNASFLSWDLKTAPMILSELVSIVDLRITRHVGLHADFVHNSLLRDTSMMVPGGEKEYRLILGAKKDDIFLGPAESRDPLFNNPIKWVKENIAKYIIQD